MNLRVHRLARYIAGNFLHKRAHGLMVIAGGCGQVYAALAQRHGCVRALPEGRLQRVVDSRSVGAANRVGPFQHIAQIAFSGHVAAIDRPGFVPNRHSYGKGIRRAGTGLGKRFPRLIDGHIAHVNTVHKHARINHIPIHVCAVLLVGCRIPRVIAQKLAVDEGIVP